MKFQRIIGISILVSLGIFTSCVSTQKETKVEDPMLANVDPSTMGTVSAGTNKFFMPGIDPCNFVMVLEPRTNVVRADFTVDVNKYSLKMGVAAREAIIAAAAKYGDDFAAKKLARKGYSRRTAYGTAKCAVEWGVLSKGARARPTVELGYTFVSDSPYFTLNIPETPNDVYEEMGGYQAKVLASMVLYFNRAQLALFTSYLEKEKIDAVIASLNVPKEMAPEGQKALNAPDEY